jgi:hypothetical protein
MILLSEVKKAISKLKPELPGCLEDDVNDYYEGIIEGYKRAKRDIKKILEQFKRGQING